MIIFSKDIFSQVLYNFLQANKVNNIKSSYFQVSTGSSQVP